MTDNRWIAIRPNDKNDHEVFLGAPDNLKLIGSVTRDARKNAWGAWGATDTRPSAHDRNAFAAADLISIRAIPSTLTDPPTPTSLKGEEQVGTGTWFFQPHRDREDGGTLHGPSGVFEWFTAWDDREGVPVLLVAATNDSAKALGLPAKLLKVLRDAALATPRGA